MPKLARLQPCSAARIASLLALRMCRSNEMHNAGVRLSLLKTTPSCSRILHRIQNKWRSKYFRPRFIMTAGVKVTEQLTILVSALSARC